MCKSLTFINDSKAIILKSVIIFAGNRNVKVTSKQRIAIFFSITFLAVIVIPTILYVVDNNFDTSIVVSISEEEQEKDGEKIVDIDVVINNEAHNFVGTDKELPKTNLVYCKKVYTSPHLFIISPPPDQA
ncbi:MAG: hypothetical protein ACPGU9_07805 [Flavobacteriaceae bacterium]